MKKEIINLDEVIDRTEAPTLKFDGDMMESIFGERDLWPSWVADMDFKASPEVLAALSRRLSHGVFGYENSSDALPNAVSSWYEKRHNWSFSTDQIVFTPRTLNSIAVAINLFSDAGEGVIVQPPVFYDFKKIISANKRRFVKNPLKFEHGKYQMDFDNLEKVTAAPNNKLLILCNPHNPLGRVWSKQDLLTLSEICISNGVYIIADEIHGDICYQNKYTPLASVSKNAALNCASCISPIKSFNLAGVANSMVVIYDDEKRKRFKDWYDRLDVNKNNVFSNAAMLAAYTDGASWLDQVIDYLTLNIEILRNFLQQKIPLVKLVEPEGTYLLWLDFRELGLDPKQLQAFLVHEAHIASNPGHWFGREGVGFARINIACPQSILITALEQLESAVNKHNNTVPRSND